MFLNKTKLVVVGLAALLAITGSASACLQVYPYSELCGGDVQGFLDAVLP